MSDDKDALLLEATQLRMQAEELETRTKEAKQPIVAMLAEWKEWATGLNQDAAGLIAEATRIERQVAKRWPDPNRQDAAIQWQP